MTENNEQTQTIETITIDLTLEGLGPYNIALLEQVHKSQVSLPVILTLQEKIDGGTLMINGVPLSMHEVDLLLKGLDLKYTEEERRIDRINNELRRPTNKQKEEENH